jgi:hypothetical protein
MATEKTWSLPDDWRFDPLKLYCWDIERRFLGHNCQFILAFIRLSHQDFEFCLDFSSDSSNI